MGIEYPESLSESSLEALLEISITQPPWPLAQRLQQRSSPMVSKAAPACEGARCGTDSPIGECGELGCASWWGYASSRGRAEQEACVSPVLVDGCLVLFAGCQLLHKHLKDEHQHNDRSYNLTNSTIVGEYLYAGHFIEETHSKSKETHSPPITI